MTKSAGQPPSGPKRELIVFGLDTAGKPKAGRFAKKHAAVATRAAKSLKLSVCPGDKQAIADILKKIPVGRLHAQGKAFIPYIKRDLFDQIQAAATPASLAAKSNPGPAVTETPAARPPRSWDDIAEGHLVLYHEGPRDGWWESLVLARDGETLTLKYRDFSRYPAFQCHFRAVALPYLSSE
ncbi:hypothetical protein [Bradyrhizobium icense]|uniref:Uncharacterized protein n=1 Tax=Bradyrhizobium icense TaxID=1274631 RepID=A0A1B1UBE7_9BRAD|nr:hypothetical protein [Bradyrhizobium icense]ANW00085.1 hypothetical protein LMTR13_07705 [Bradyrhizobium icense]